MQLEELRMNKKMGEDDPTLVKDLEGHKAQFEKKYEELAEELKNYWKQWDRLLTPTATRRGAASLDSMVDLLNRRSYIRNLVRDVNEVLETKRFADLRLDFRFSISNPKSESEISLCQLTASSVSISEPPTPWWRSCRGIRLS